MSRKIYETLIPAPASVTPLSGVLLLQDIKGVYCDEAFRCLQDEFAALGAYFELDFSRAAEADAVIVCKMADMKNAGAWSIRIENGKVVLTAGEMTGIRYAFSALTQMLFTAGIQGLKEDALDCVLIQDEPRFTWRSFMLDSARHFQKIDVIKQVLNICAALRLNTFHWHLVDNQGWRLPLASTANLTAAGSYSDGQYTRAELEDVVAYAKRLGITIVPEVDIPGHSNMLITNYPQLACDPADPGSELCIGNPETIEFMKKVFRELMDIFTDSPYIHIGGDEAETEHWEKCEKCRAAMEKRGLKSMRELENAFMVDMSRFIVENGRTPMIWGTCSGQVYPADTIIQVWLDIREPLRVAPNGNKTVYSVHTSLYFDYPANLSEPWETWMFELKESGVYMTDPYIIWPEKVKDSVLGTEACLWTETVPQRRVIQKVLPRIFAYSECAWSAVGRKDYHDFVARKELLEAAGYMQYLQQL